MSEHSPKSCRCRVTRYKGNQAVECVVCGTRYPEGVPADAIMLNHDCEICRRHVVRFTCDDFAAVPAEHRKFVDDLHSAAVDEIIAGQVLKNDAERLVNNKIYAALGGSSDVDWSAIFAAVGEGLAGFPLDAISAWNTRAPDPTLVQQQEEIGRLRRALEFYAEERNWRSNGSLDANSGNFDGASRARIALEIRDADL